MVPLRVSLLLILQFFRATVGDDDPCNTDTTMSTQMTEIVEGGKELGKLFSGNESVDWEKVGTGYLGYLQFGMETVQAIPVVGSAVLGIFKMLLPSKASSELKCMVQEFKKVNTKLDKIERGIQELSQKITGMFKKLTDHISVQTLNQDYNKIGEHKRVVVDALKLYFDDPVQSKANTLNSSCYDHNPFLKGLRAIEVLVTNEGRIGTEFLKGIIDASANSQSAYSSVVRLITDNVNELVDLDKICDTFLHPNSDESARIRIMERTNKTAQNIFEALVNGEYYRQTNVFNELIENDLSQALNYNSPLRVNYLVTKSSTKSADGTYENRTAEYDEGGNPSGTKRVIAYLENQLNLMLWYEVTDTDRLEYSVQDAEGKDIPHTGDVSWSYENELFVQSCKTTQNRKCEKTIKSVSAHNGHDFSITYYKPTNVTDAMPLLNPLFIKRKEKLSTMIKSK